MENAKIKMRHFLVIFVHCAEKNVFWRFFLHIFSGDDDDFFGDDNDDGFGASDDDPWGEDNEQDSFGFDDEESEESIEALGDEVTDEEFKPPKDSEWESQVKPKAEFVDCQCEWGLFRDRNVTMREPIRLHSGVNDLNKKGIGNYELQKVNHLELRSSKIEIVWNVSMSLPLRGPRSH